LCRIREAQVVVTPSVTMLSLTAIGRPASGPRIACISRSTLVEYLAALSAVTRM